MTKTNKQKIDSAVCEAMVGNVPLNAFLNTSPEGLAKEQERHLANYAAEKLTRLARHIREGNYATAASMLAESPSGDEMGCDNRYISFAELELNVDKHGCNMTDLGDVLDRLGQLQMLGRKAT